MSHENSITVQNKYGRWVNLPTVYKGKSVTEAKALALHHAGYLKPLDGKTYSSEPVASYRARKRSQQHSFVEGVRPPDARR